MKSMFSIDVEEWFDGFYPDQAPAHFESRLQLQLESLLQLLDDAHTKATFFWLGSRAKEHPKLVELLAKQGHEIGCHGMHHTPVYDLTPRQFKAQMIEASSAICQITGKPLLSFRAPFFSITSRSYWALDILCELGYQYDSSVFPINHWRYGMPGFRQQVQTITTESGKITELPLPVRQFGQTAIPVSGGAYFRIYPYSFTKNNIQYVLRKGLPMIFYFHPWELDPHHPKHTRAPLRTRLPHYYNLSATKDKLELLLKDFSFTSIQRALSAPELSPEISSELIAPAMTTPQIIPQGAL